MKLKADVGHRDLTEGAVGSVILRFALPLLLGNLLQQLYNVTDSVIVGQFLGKQALAAVSASFFIYYLWVKKRLYFHHASRQQTKLGPYSSALFRRQYRK